MNTRHLYREDLIRKLYEQGKSPYEIAEELGENWNHMKVRRILKKAGVVLRDKSEAQKNALKSGRTKHPNQKDQDYSEGSYNIEEEEEYEL